MGTPHDDQGADRRGGLASIVERLDALPRWWLPVAVGVLGLLLRVWTLWEQRGANPLVRNAILDDLMYLDLADGILDGSGADRAWFLAPLYPWVLALAARIGDVDTLTASTVSLTAGTAAAVLIALGARTLHSQAAGYVAGVLYAAAGTFVFHDIIPGQEPLLAALHAAGFWATVVWLRRGAAWTGGVVGLIGGLAMYGRGTAISILVAAGALVAWRHRRASVRGIALMALGAVVVVLPGAFRNQSAVGDFTPLPWSFGSNLYISNGPYSRAHTGFATGELAGTPARMEEVAREKAEKAAGRPLRPSEISAYWVERTIEERGTLGETILHFGKKALLFWAARDYGNNHWAPMERRFSTWIGIVPVTTWWLLALGLGGWWLVRRRVPEADVAALTIALVWAALVVVFPVSRYRLPIVPLAGICAAAGLVELLGRGAPRRRTVVAGVLVLVAGVVAFMEDAYRKPPPLSPAYYNLAFAFVMEGDRTAAMEVIEESFRREPKDGRMNELMGRVLLDEDRFADGMRYLHAANDDVRTRFTAGVAAMYALVRLEQGANAEGVRAYLERTFPDECAKSAEYKANAALVYVLRSETAGGEEKARLIAEARRLLDEAEALEPESDPVRRARTVIPK